MSTAGNGWRISGIQDPSLNSETTLLRLRNEVLLGDGYFSALRAEGYNKDEGVFVTEKNT